MLIVVTSLEERLIVYQGKDRSVPAKMAILVQTTLSGFIMLSSIALILVQDSRLDILINFPALIFINEIPHYVGLHLHKFLKTHHTHLVTREDYLKFDTKPSHHAIILSFMQAHIANFCTSLALLWAVQKRKCKDFDNWFQKTFGEEKRERAIPVFHTVLDWGFMILMCLNIAHITMPTVCINLIKSKLEKKFDE